MVLRQNMEETTKLTKCAFNPNTMPTCCTYADKMGLVRLGASMTLIVQVIVGVHLVTMIVQVIVDIHLVSGYFQKDMPHSIITCCSMEVT